MEDGVKTVILIHGLASCALRGKTSGSAGFLCDYCDLDADERLLYVSIQELAKRPHIVKSLALNWEPAAARHEDGNEGQRTFKTAAGYENAKVYPVEGLDGIRTLNPGIESEVAPVYLWHNVIEHLSEYNLLAFNYDWRRWGDVIYIARLVPKFKEQLELAVKVSRQPTVVVAHSLGAQVITYMMGLLGPEWTEAHISDVVLVGPATIGFALSLCWVRTITHSSVVPVANFMEIRLRDVASTWPGMLAVMPTPLNGLDVVLLNSRHFLLSSYRPLAARRWQPRRGAVTAEWTPLPSWRIWPTAMRRKASIGCSMKPGEFMRRVEGGLRTMTSCQ